MEDRKLNERESLELITQMIRNTKKTLSLVVETNLLYGGYRL